MEFHPLPLLRPAPPDIPSLAAAGDIDGLIRLLSHPDIDTRWKAAEALGTLGQPALDDLIRELHHHDVRVRLGIIEALGDIGDPRALPPLLAILAEERSTEIRWAAVLALGNLGDAGAIPSLVQALQDPDKYVRFGAASALGQLAWEPARKDEKALFLIARQEWDSLPALGTDAVSPLLRASRDQDPAIRARAVDILGTLGDARGAETCDLILRDPDSEVRWRGVLAFPRCGVPLGHLPMGLVRRPRIGKSRLLATLLNLVFLGDGYGYLDKWYGLLIYQVSFTAVVVASLVWGPLIPYVALYFLSAIVAVQTWFSTKGIAEGEAG